MSSRKSIVLPNLGESGDALIAAKIKALLKRHGQHIVITGHERPDGDCIGSEIALCATLRKAGYDAEVVNSDAVAERYAFLDPECYARVAGNTERLDASLVFVLDATDLRRLGRVKPEHWGAAKVVNIDHHLDNPRFGQLNWVDKHACATGELIWRLLSAWRIKVPPVAQSALYTAIVTDTGQFSYSNTTPRALRMGAALVENGVDPEHVWQKIYLNKSPAEMALESRARSSLECYAGGKICCIGVTDADYRATGTGPHNTEEFAHIPRSVAGMEMALFFYEVDHGRRTKVSIRTTRHYNACALAKHFGGGGHRQAAGCSLPMQLQKSKEALLQVAIPLVANGQKPKVKGCA